MSYSKTTWKTGDTITAQLLNHAEDGIAANDAAIAAIPTGVQLYGPYTASGTATIVAGAGETDVVALQNMEDVNGITVDFPDDTDALILLSYYTSGAQTCAVQGAGGPYVYDGSWEPASVTLMNTASSESSGRVAVAFYSTVEFPPLA